MFQNLFNDIPMAGQRPGRIQGPSRQPAPRHPDEVVRAQNEAAASEFDPRLAEARAREAEARARIAEADLQRGGGSAAERQQMATRRANMEAATQQFMRLGELYQGGYQGGGMFDSIMESLPDAVSESNSQFNAAAAGLSEAAFAALRVPGVGTQSDAELRQFLRANEPRAQAFDSTIEERLDTVQTRLNAQRAELGLPPADWRGQQEPVQLPGADRSNRPVGAPAQEQQTLSGGETRLEEDPVLRGISGRLGRMVADGTSDQEIVRFLREAGVNPAETNIAPVLNFRRSRDFQTWRAQNPGEAYPIGPSFYTREVPQSGVRRAISAISESPLGAYGASAGQALTGNRLDDAVGWTGGNAEQARAGIAGLRENNPIASLAGDISGQGLAMTGAGRIAGRVPGLTMRIGANPLTRTATRRALAGDAAYGAYAGSGDDNLVGGTLANMAGGQIGAGLTRGAGRVIGGTRDAAVRALDARGFPLTVGQIAGQGGMVGRTLRGIENRAAGFPVIGDLISNQQRQGIGAGVREAHQEVLNQIGGTATNEVGEEAFDSTLGQVQNAFRDALRGVNLRSDRPFSNNFRAASRAAARPALTQEVRDITGSALAQIDELFVGGQLSGDGLQAALQILGEARSAVAGLPMGQGGISALRQTEQALTGLARRQAPAVMPALNRARQAYRRLSVVRDATRSAAGEANGMFTPLQLNRADVNNTAQFGGRNASASTRRPFYELTNAMRQVLPNRVPDSGTAGRAALGAGALVGTGAGSDALGVTDDGTGLALGGAVAAGTTLPYTNLGRGLFQGAMVRRPESFRRAGDELIDNEWLQYISRLIGASQGPYQTTERY